MNLNADTDHPLSEGLASSDVISLRYQSQPDGDEAYLDLVVTSRGKTRAFRFLSPHQLTIGESFPHIGYLKILDIQMRQLGALKLLVYDGEQSEAIRFYARTVQEISP